MILWIIYYILLFKKILSKKYNKYQNPYYYLLITVSITGIINYTLTYFHTIIPLTPGINKLYIPYKPSNKYGLLNFFYLYTTFAYYVSLIMLLLNIFQAFDEKTTILSRNIYFEIFGMLIIPIPMLFYTITSEAQLQYIPNGDTIKSNYMILKITTKNNLTNSLDNILKICYYLYISYSIIFMIIIIKRFIKNGNKKNHLKKIKLTFLLILLQYPNITVKIIRHIYKIEDYLKTKYLVPFLFLSFILSTIFTIVIIIIIDKNSRKLFYYK
uniref:Uncharacterized protein n=1 Tax=Strongyloides stercoralis TaxID=6248 RepID=A0AAF5DDN8_STRER